MPITKSAKKAFRQNVTRRGRNLRKKETYKNAVKEFRGLIAEKNFDAAKAALIKTFKALDKAAKVGVIKKNKASRLKSRLAARLGKK